MNPAPPLMLLHGWGFSSRIWQPLMKVLPAHWPGPVFAIDLPGFGTAFHEPCGGLDDAIDFMLEQLPARSVLCGWSLGGMLAMQLAARHPDRIAGLVTLGSNLRFTRDGDWPGMPPKDYREFCERFATYPEKTWQQFLTLQTRGDLYSGQYSPVIKQLSSFDDIDPDMAAKMLDLLGALDNRALFPQLTLPGLHILGEHDVITPSAVADKMRELNAQLNAQQRVQVLPSASHALCITRIDDLTAYLRDFARQLATPAPLARPARTETTRHHSAAVLPANAIDRKAIARSFSRAAATYDDAASLQRTVAEQLLQQVDVRERGVTLDAGCGTGFLSQALRPYSDYSMGLDLASGMLHTLREQCGSFVAPLQGDMQQLPLADASVDRIVSSLALQWCSQPLAFFRECRRVLRDGASLYVSTFLPGTLQELQHAWSTVDQAVHVNTFTDLMTLLNQLERAGFTAIEAEQQTLLRHYPDLASLTRELKSIGAHNMNPGRPRGLTGKHRWQQLVAAYDSLRTADGLPAQYEVLYIAAR